jgi:hypothetical protein
VVRDVRGLDYELLRHPRTQTPRAEANAVGIAAREVAKTVELTTNGRFVKVPAHAVLPLAS